MEGGWPPHLMPPHLKQAIPFSKELQDLEALPFCKKAKTFSLLSVCFSIRHLFMLIKINCCMTNPCYIRKVKSKET